MQKIRTPTKKRKLTKDEKCELIILLAKQCIILNRGKDITFRKER